MLSHLQAEFNLLDDLAFCQDRTVFAVTKRHSMELVTRCEQKGYILRRDNVFLITPLGLERHSELELLLFQAEKESQQLSAQNAHSERNTRSDRRFQFFLQLFLTLLAYALGLITEHFSGILELLLSLLH